MCCLRLSLKILPLSLIFPLSILFRAIIDLHELPTEWKEAVITPIFKKGDPSDISNYRPIAITCICCKLLESIVVSDLLQYLNNHNLINKCQHGFPRKHSCLTNLLESCRDWTVSLSNHKSVVIGSIDFQKAFDTVTHSKLLHKLIGLRHSREFTSMDFLVFVKSNAESANMDVILLYLPGSQPAFRKAVSSVPSSLIRLIMISPII